MKRLRLGLAVERKRKEGLAWMEEEEGYTRRREGLAWREDQASSRPHHKNRRIVVAVDWKGAREVPLTKEEAKIRLVVPVVLVVAAVRKLEIAHQELQVVHSH